MSGLKRWDEIYKRIKGIKIPMVAEVGVDNAKLSKQLLLKHSGLVLYMIDWWQQPPNGSSYAKSDASIVKKDKNYFIKTYENCKSIANQFKKRCKILRGESAAMAANIDDNSLDLVFIDADHSYEGCKHDIKAWLPKVKKGGYISGHDYNHPDQGEVKKAVDEMFGKDIVLGENRCWFHKVV
jgi:murein L,D-transpeptidase YafK